MRIENGQVYVTTEEGHEVCAGVEADVRANYSGRVGEIETLKAEAAARETAEQVEGLKTFRAEVARLEAVKAAVKAAEAAEAAEAEAAAVAPEEAKAK